MRFLLMLAAVLLPWTALQAAKEKALTAAQILDEVVTRPGDFDQMCDPPPAVPYGAPPIPAFGLSVPQTLFPSDEMKALLLAHRAEIIKEMQSRFEKLDWLHPPPAPPIPKKALFIKKEPGNEEFDPTEPSGQNPRVLGGIVLTIVGDLEAVELLPQLLRLEDSLHTITQAALKDAKAPVPSINIGGGALWEGMLEEEEKLGNNEKFPPEFERKVHLFRALVFDRQMLGVMLQLLQHQNYAPLKDSTSGLLHTMSLKRKPLDEEMAKIKRPEDIPESERRYVFFDKDLGIPYWRYEHADVLYSEPMRNEVRGLVQAFVSGTAPPVITGKEIVEDALRDPGGYNQMCGMPRPLPFNAPVPVDGVLAPRNFLLDRQMRQMMQAHRGKVVPVLADDLQALNLQNPQPEKAESHPSCNLLLDAVRTVDGIETLPELLKIEADLHGSLAKARDGKIPLAPLDLDSPITWIRDKRSDSNEHTQAEFTRLVLQREVLGLIAMLLRDEDYEPYFNTELEKERAVELRTIAASAELKDIKTEQDIPYEKRDSIGWDKRLGIPVKRSGTHVTVPYSDALRDELRHVAEDFLKNVPPSQWKGEAAMKLIGLPQ